MMWYAHWLTKCFDRMPRADASCLYDTTCAANVASLSMVTQDLQEIIAVPQGEGAPDVPCKSAIRLISAADEHAQKGYGGLCMVNVLLAPKCRWCSPDFQWCCWSCCCQAPAYDSLPVRQCCLEAMTKFCKLKFQMPAPPLRYWNAYESHWSACSGMCSRTLQRTRNGNQAGHTTVARACMLPACFSPRPRRPTMYDAHVPAAHQKALGHLISLSASKG